MMGSPPTPQAVAAPPLPTPVGAIQGEKPKKKNPQASFLGSAMTLSEAGGVGMPSSGGGKTLLGS